MAEYLNILPLFTEIEKNNCFRIYTGSEHFQKETIKNRFTVIDLSIHAFTPAILFLFLFGLRIIHSVGVNNAH